MLNHDTILSKITGVAGIQPLIQHRKRQLGKRALRQAGQCLDVKTKMFMARLYRYFEQWHIAPHGRAIH
ncbi:MAG: hypothetical protein HC898_06055 [Phycisphaerales bacterium]|nr:hypothetical protein [Phycisphaerales bacterium]